MLCGRLCVLCVPLARCELVAGGWASSGVGVVLTYLLVTRKRRGAKVPAAVAVAGMQQA
jgi:hypothetical protein